MSIEKPYQPSTEEIKKSEKIMTAEKKEKSEKYFLDVKIAKDFFEKEGDNLEEIYKTGFGEGYNSPEDMLNSFVNGRNEELIKILKEKYPSVDISKLKVIHVGEIALTLAYDKNDKKAFTYYLDSGGLIYETNYFTDELDKKMSELDKNKK